MSARTKARKRAIDVLFAADVRDEPAAELLAQEAERARTQPERETSWRYAREIVLGVLEHQDEIDELLTSYARGWTLERMPALDRAILRMAVWEIRWNDEVPTAVAITEAVEAAKQYSTDDSGRFVHGLLGRIAESVPPVVES
ncbi:transcription antitermination factor NusB [Pseudoclavibacter chungangensis]|uniref:Transcription antitermination protein NusB n=1 Tax=Pseudoclavibacter chungangensis TaxID=587635 RepID=A0A7J5BUR5_9MICO|nr:transcription antitermination factor NusB [Pseudoclavibacter chungangensis]KAB1657853.1 transcription antitermination factor NusB [Pseudoclavibacter chungangensis]NYJ66547.1 N utilization substance protein B [Pseudoclavibacter chungangensis]